MRKLVLLVCMAAALPLLSGSSVRAGIIPSWEAPSGKIGFYPICNEISLYRSCDDSGRDRGKTVQIISINSFKLLTTFSFELSADYNFDYTPGLSRDHYIEIGLVKHLSDFFSLNVQRVISTFEDESINQFGVRLSF
jgi:hypothetical protein